MLELQLRKISYYNIFFAEIKYHRTYMNLFDLYVNKY